MNDQELIDFVAEAMRPDAFDPQAIYNMSPMEAQAWRDQIKLQAMRAIKAYEQCNANPVTGAEVLVKGAR